MFQRPQRHGRDEQGFTLVELLVVILVVGILAAIAIPSFLAQRTKGTNASAKSVARTAETAAETYSTDHSGSYSGIEASRLHEIDTSLAISSGGSANAWLEAAQATESNNGYKVTATSSTGATFSVIRKASGAVERVCTGTSGGCTAGGSW